jgi:transposase-like protein
MRRSDSAMQKELLQNCQSGFSVRVASSRHRLLRETIGKKYLCLMLSLAPWSDDQIACIVIPSDLETWRSNKSCSARTFL